MKLAVALLQTQRKPKHVSSMQGFGSVCDSWIMLVTFKFESDVLVSTEQSGNHLLRDFDGAEAVGLDWQRVKQGEEEGEEKQQ